MKKIVIIAIAVLLLIGGGWLAFMNGLFGNGKTEMTSEDYVNSTVESFTPVLYYDRSYVDGVSNSDPVFVAIINSPEYKAKVVEIMKSTKTESDNLQKSINNQIIDEYKAIESINASTGFKEDGFRTSMHNFERIVDTHHTPLESWPSFLTRFKNYLESQNIDSYYDRANAEYQSKIPQNIVDVYNTHDIQIDFKKDAEIIRYLTSGVHFSSQRDPNTMEWITQRTFDENVPEGTTLEFMQDYYDVFVPAQETLSQIRGSISNSDNYKEYERLTDWEDELNLYYSHYYEKIGPDYASQIQSHIDNIDKLQENYITDCQQIQNNTNKLMRNLQKSLMNL